MFAENVTHFARVLRRAGVPVGPDRVIAALEAIEAVGFSHRDDVHAAQDAREVGDVLSEHRRGPSRAVR